MIRRVGSPIIDFLHQLEDFQKRLWLKKRFVLETHYCIALRMFAEIADESERDELISEVSGNEAQRTEWEQLGVFGLVADENESLFQESESATDLLDTLPSLFIDTKHFTLEFEHRLLQAISKLDDFSDGVLVNAENFQGLAFLGKRFSRQVKCVYSDPPYNTGGDGFAYKDNYSHSSWQTMFSDRLSLAKPLLCSDGISLTSINDIELANLRFLLDTQFGIDNRIGTVVWKGATDNNPTRIATEHEYVVCYANDKAELEPVWSTADSDAKQIMLTKYSDLAESGMDLHELRANFAEFCKAQRETLGDLYRYRRIDAKGPYAARRNMENPGKKGPTYDVIHPVTKKPCDRPFWGWRFSESTMEQLLSEDRIIFGENEKKIPELKVHLVDVRFPLRSVVYMDARKGSNNLERLFGSRDVFKNPKPVEFLNTLLPFVTDLRSIVLDAFAGSGSTGHAVIDRNREDGGNRRFILIEMGKHFDSVVLPRIKKVSFQSEWKSGRASRFPTQEEVDRSPRIVKYIRLESYEDTLNNLDKLFDEDSPARKSSRELPKEMALDYKLRYMLDMESRGSQSLLNVEGFADPNAYKLQVKIPGSDASREVNVDLIETFNWLIGLRVEHFAAPQTFDAKFERPTDPELPEDQQTRLCVKGWSGPDEKGRLKYGTFKQCDDKPDNTPAKDRPWWFRKIEGWVPKNLSDPDGPRDKILIVWRRLTGDLEKDNLMLDCFFQQNRISTRDFEFDTIYVNGSNNLPNLKRDEETWKVRLIEEDFHRLMWDVQDV
ncbi:type III restriction-modification system methylation subunit [Rhodopirellula maiorica SM1]|uniref:Type III restriction-modification system methylation subunit n=1 Tax=Rhodopirellula maiorica SM1 TaxID=1265738 RepID=M5RGG0_9BACT|nr:site-specific DNA-methyltransferase [Rhodopirellula maiorica]EMI18478.1 type III restriction-modification system methylation subunit [Rhodopirellula maiorica SM1]